MESTGSLARFLESEPATKGIYQLFCALTGCLHMHSAINNDYLFCYLSVDLSIIFLPPNLQIAC